MSNSNPNKVNQYTAPDPRQSIFLKYYFDQKSETFSNALQSALKAGYAQQYAESITAAMPAWLEDYIREHDLVMQAEKNLKNFLSDEEKDSRIKADMTKFTLERLKKEKYSARKELTGKDGEKLTDNSEILNKVEQLLQSYGKHKDL